MKDVDYWINHLKLEEHPEGGYYKETYRSDELVKQNALPNRFDGDRNFSTAIFYLIQSQKNSKLHKIKSDELWHFYYGNALQIYILNPEHSDMEVVTLGSDLDLGQQLQIVIPKNTWFGAKVLGASGYTLAGCTVAPGFDFEDFEMADSKQLINTYPRHKNVITSLT